MARSRLPDPFCVPIGLTVTEDDAARIDQVLARPEFAGWSRSEWCLAIIRTALRYYVREPGADEAQTQVREAPAPVREAPAEEAPPVIAEEEPPGRPDCPHPADARDYDSGTCAACGAILWD